MIIAGIVAAVAVVYGLLLARGAGDSDRTIERWHREREEGG